MLFSGNLRQSSIFLKKTKKPLRVQSHTDISHDKRASQSASEEGSMTVEAAMVIPLLLCAFTAILIWGRVFLLQQEMESALLETARQLARQEYLCELKDKEGSSILTAAALLTVNRKQGDDGKGIRAETVRFSDASYKEETKEIHLELKYHIKIPLMLLGTWSFPVKLSITQKAWNGYAPRTEIGGAEEGKRIYITEHGDVYHTDGQCFHLNITIRKTGEISDFYEGKTKYRPCEYCVSGAQRMDELFLTEDGECYHEELSCQGLTRTVRTVSIEQIEGRRLCQDCGNEG